MNKLSKEKDTEKVAVWVKEQRKELCFTQEQFAAAVGLCTSTITRLEAARYYPRHRTIIKMIKFLNQEWSRRDKLKE